MTQDLVTQFSAKVPTPGGFTKAEKGIHYIKEQIQ